ncbi:uncharacterized protein METZ01_LOCUS31294 [marine metagenome]|uniref:histidine kinase n=1 Tax=marine metagenome TaxID=408172 RepID=A0A381QHL4_9ZZZZ
MIQVITNLSSNAIKFTPSGGLIPVQLPMQPDPDLKTGALIAEISVGDNGVGITAAELDMILKRFQQAGKTLSGRPHGANLGLAISKEIVVYPGEV